MSIYRYVLVDKQDHEGDHEYDDYEQAVYDAGDDHAVIAREYTFEDSELLWTPDGSDTWPPKPEHVLYECEICSGLHPWDWNGDCRDNANRYPAVEEYARLHDLDADAIEVRSMSDRVQADQA